MQAIRFTVIALAALGIAAAEGVQAQGMAKDAKAASAEKGKAVVKVLHEDARVRVTETTFKPGDAGPNIVRGFRVTRPLTNGSLERTWADGKKEKVERKAGEVIVAGPDKQAFFVKNVGKSDYRTYTVAIKEAKK